MHHSIIACEVFRAELELLVKEFRFSHGIHFLPQGLHDSPDQLKVRLQEKIDLLESSENPPKKILLFYGFCGRGVCGVHAGNATMVLPRTHDCIPLLLGMPQEKKDRIPTGSKTFWVSPGWLKYSQLPFIKNKGKRFSEYRKQFDEDSARYLIDLESSWLKEYVSARLICWDDWETISPSLKQDGRFLANDAGLPYSEIRGSRQYMVDLLQGGENEKRFLQVAPGHTVSMDACGALMTKKII